MEFDIKKYFYKTNPQYYNDLLFHHTPYLNEILETDILNVNNTIGGVLSISFTRCSYYSEFCGFGERIVLDHNKMKIDGYKTTPYDEIPMRYITRNDNVNFKKRMMGYSKVNPNTVGRLITNKLGIEGVYNKKTAPLEWEYEERIFRKIKNLGKYIISIDIPEKKIKHYILILKDYLDKYPHIEITILDNNNPYDRRKKVSFNELYNEYKEYRDNIDRVVLTDLFNDIEDGDLYKMLGSL